MSLDSILDIASRAPVPEPDEVRRILGDRGVSLKELAGAVGVHPVTMSKWLAGTQRPTGIRAAVYSQTIALLRDG